MDSKKGKTKFKPDGRGLLIVIVLAAGAWLCWHFYNQPQTKPPAIVYKEPASPVIGVSADNELAVEAGMEILRQGGNAVDAAITVSYMLAVVEPFASGPGGGGIMIIAQADGSEPVVIDYLTTYPALTPGTSSVQSCTPGFTAGLDMAHRRFGSMPMAKLLAPAIETARNGFAVNASLSRRLAYGRNKITGDSAVDYFPEGQVPKAGSILKEPELAASLQSIADEGPQVIYTGRLAQAIDESGCGVTMKALEAYSPIARQPVKADFMDYTVYAAPPPAAGITVLQALELGNRVGLSSNQFMSPQFIAGFAAINDAVYKERLRYVADPAFQAVDTGFLLAPEHMSELEAQVQSSSPVPPPPGENPDDVKAANTTHFAIIDKYGNMVSCTNSIDTSFGTGLEVGGFFMNDGLNNFSSNSASINYPKAGQRARTYICPLVLYSGQRPFMAIGTPGGSAIPQVLQQVLYQRLAYGSELQAAIEAPRFFTDGSQTILTESEFPEELKQGLAGLGLSSMTYDNPIFFGAVNALDVRADRGEAGSDPRREGYAAIELVDSSE